MPERIPLRTWLGALAMLLGVLVPCCFVGHGGGEHATLAALTAAMCLFFTGIALWGATASRDGGAAPHALGAVILAPALLFLSWVAMQAPLFEATHFCADLCIGSAVRAWGRIFTLGICGLIIVASLVLFMVFGRRLDARIVASVPSPVLGVVATATVACLIGVVAATIWETRGRAPSDAYFDSLPIVDEARKAGNYDVDGHSRVPRLVLRTAEYQTQNCRVGDLLQATQNVCSGVVLKYDARMASWLVEANTDRGGEPIEWCQSESPTQQHCPNFLHACDVARSVGPPRTWVATAVAGALLAALTLVRGLRRDRKTEYAMRSCLAALCVALTSTPLIVYRAMSGPCPIETVEDGHDQIIRAAELISHSNNWARVTVSHNAEKSRQSNFVSAGVACVVEIGPSPWACDWQFERLLEVPAADKGLRWESRAALSG